MEKLYKITGKTNRWIAQHDPLFKGKEYFTIVNNLSLHQAHVILCTFFDCDYNTAYGNWELIQKNHPSLTWSCSDGTRGYEYDSRYYSIEEQEGEEEQNYGIV